MKEKKEKKQRRENGITLVALVVTIVILIILSTITINVVFDDGGLIDIVKGAKNNAEDLVQSEDKKMNDLLQEYANIMGENVDIPDPELPKDTTPPTVNIVVREVTETSIAVTVNATDDSGEITSYKYYLNGTLKDILTANGYTYTGLTSGTSYTIKVEAFDKVNNKGENSVTATTKTASIPTTSSYVGYYADIEGDGTVDGIIYADLAKGNTGDGQWADSDGNYTIPVEANLKGYYVSKESYTGDFGTKDVISPVKEQSGKNDRFYIMALDDIDVSEHYWYKSAFGKMSIDTDTAFGTGKINTQTMINQWNSNKYPPQDNNDMWKLIQSQESKGWFVPSKEEWSAFAGELGITKTNYTTKGLSTWYWSSSQKDINNAYHANFSVGFMASWDVDFGNCVRLSTTF